MKMQINKGDIVEISGISHISNWKFIGLIRNEFIDSSYDGDWFLFEKAEATENSYKFGVARPIARFDKNNIWLDWKMQYYGMSIDDLSSHHQRGCVNKWILVND